MFGFSLAKIGIYAAAALIASGVLFGTYRYWRHSVWVEGKNAALEAVAKQNATAADAASKVALSIDACFDAGRFWNVSSGKCE